MRTDDLMTLMRRSTDRFSFWTGFIGMAGVQSMAEIGVWHGEFAERLLAGCPQISRYYMIDPWRHLDCWRKPANRSNDEFEAIRRDALRRTGFAGDRRVELRGTTADVIDAIPDHSLDFAYIDGDHTLRGITMDLHLVAPKIKPGGWIGGDDFWEDVWHHGPDYEPTQVFPYAVYFAELTRSPIWAVGHKQFLIQLGAPRPGYVFEDLTGAYPAPTVLDAGGMRRHAP